MSDLMDNYLEQYEQLTEDEQKNIGILVDMFCKVMNKSIKYDEFKTKIGSYSEKIQKLFVKVPIPDEILIKHGLKNQP